MLLLISLFELTKLYNCLLFLYNNIIYIVCVQGSSNVLFNLEYKSGYCHIVGLIVSPHIPVVLKGFRIQIRVTHNTYQY